MKIPDWQKSVGFTGTRHGMNDYQKSQLRARLTREWRAGARWFHHGVCPVRGNADLQAEEIARELGFKIAVHPANQSLKEDYANADFVFPPAPFLDRDDRITMMTKKLLAAPRSMREELRSGTWATVRYARQRGKAVHIVWPQKR